MGKDYISWINDHAYYIRRVPLDVMPYVEDKKKWRVRISLKTKDPKEARRKADIYNAYMEDFWQNIILTEGVDQEKAYNEAVAKAKAHGFAYRHASHISASSSAPEIVSRLNKALDFKDDAPAILGGVDKPTIKLSQAAEKYRSISQDILVGKSEDQARKWFNPKKKAMKNFIKVVGDIDASQLTRSHILDFRRWWLDRIDSEGLGGGSANKDFLHIKGILERISIDLDIDIDVDELFKKVRVKEIKQSRLPYDNDYIKDVLIGSPALDNLNKEARMLVYAMIDTGCRDTELVGLLPDEIILDHDVPHIIIQPNKIRGLKTPHSERKIPLVGMSLKAFKEMPNGFTHYRSGVLDNASNAIGKYFRENNLNPTDRHSLYSLRHSFKDRLREVDAGDEIRDALIGHLTDKPQYGSGFTLEAKKRWLDKIVF